jgi:hypothetical protein
MTRQVNPQIIRVTKPTTPVTKRTIGFEYRARPRDRVRRAFGCFGAFGLDAAGDTRRSATKGGRFLPFPLMFALAARFSFSGILPEPVQKVEQALHLARARPQLPLLPNLYA